MNWLNRWLEARDRRKADLEVQQDYMQQYRCSQACSLFYPADGPAYAETKMKTGVITRDYFTEGKLVVLFPIGHPQLVEVIPYASEDGDGKG